MVQLDNYTVVVNTRKAYLTELFMGDLRIQHAPGRLGEATEL